MDTLTTPRALPARRCELASDESRLRPTFRKRDGVALIVSNVVGVGIFTTPCVVAALVPHAAGILSLWLVGGFLALAGNRSHLYQSQNELITYLAEKINRQNEKGRTPAPTAKRCGPNQNASNQPTSTLKAGRNVKTRSI